MDPNANLAEQERCIVAIRDRDYMLPKAGIRLKELRDALRLWLRAGGFHPDWDAYPEAKAGWIRHGQAFVP